MSKYLELFKGTFDDSIGTKTKPENKPYIGYSLTEGKMTYTVVPAKVEGPADNEIWYTTTTGDIKPIHEVIEQGFDKLGIHLISNTYENGKGIFVFDNTITEIPDSFGAFFAQNDSYILYESIYLPNKIATINTNFISTGCNELLYNGTVSEWNNITKLDYWNINSNVTYVKCIDGNVDVPIWGGM